MIVRYGRAATRRARETAFEWSRPIRALRRAGGEPPRSLVLHGGLRKTGSTTVQAMLHENRDRLTRHADIVTRFTPVSTAELARTSHEFQKRCDRRSRIRFEMAAERFAAKLRQLPRQTVIVSDENILATSLVEACGDIFDMSAMALETLVRSLPDFRIHVVLYTRERERWLESCYNQAVRWHRYTGDREAWMRINRRCRDWETGLAFLRGAVDLPITAVRMEEALSGEPVLGATILRIAGVPEEVIGTLSAPVRKNESIGPAQLEFMRSVNELGMTYRQTHAVAKVVRAHPELFRP